MLTSNQRALYKSISYRSIVVIVSLFFLGFEGALWFNAIMMVIYFAHEKIWQKIK
jgi:uncharacterized membrane protein